MSDIEMEKELEVRTTAPRVKLSALEEVIKEETYFVHNNVLTICVLTLVNGFMVIGESACASPENYHKDIGERISREKAEKEIWPLLGYALRQKLYEEEQAGQDTSWLGRLQKEAFDLEDKYNKLNSFIEGRVQFDRLSENKKEQLLAQRNAMKEYLNILINRVSLEV